MGYIYSYSQNGEDALLARLFEGQKTGFYIDIGASHPEKLSVTKRFYDYGWRGINIDPIISAIELFNEIRPDDLNINCAIGLSVGVTEFNFVKNYPELSAVNLKDTISSGYLVETIYVNMMRGDDIFENHVKTTVDFLKIDVEGHEYEVIKSIDWMFNRPRVLVVEATIPNADFPGWENFDSILTHDKWEFMLLDADYKFAYFDGLNRYYIRSEDQELLKRLQFGICHWDKIIPVDLAKQIADLQYHCDERLKQIKTLIEIINTFQIKL